MRSADGFMVRSGYEESAGAVGFVVLAFLGSAIGRVHEWRVRVHCDGAGVARVKVDVEVFEFEDRQDFVWRDDLVAVHLFDEAPCFQRDHFCSVDALGRVRDECASHGMTVKVGGDGVSASLFSEFFFLPNPAIVLVAEGAVALGALVLGHIQRLVGALLL